MFLGRNCCRARSAEWRWLRDTHRGSHGAGNIFLPPIYKRAAPKNMLYVLAVTDVTPSLQRGTTRSGRPSLRGARSSLSTAQVKMAATD